MEIINILNFEKIKFWCHWGESHPRPFPYHGNALLLCHNDRDNKEYYLYKKKTIEFVKLFLLTIEKVKKIYIFL